MNAKGSAIRTKEASRSRRSRDFSAEAAIEAIPLSPNRDQENWNLRIRLDLPSELRDMDVHGACFDVLGTSVSPDFRKQFFAAHRAIGMAAEIKEDLDFLSGERKRFSPILDETHKVPRINPKRIAETEL